MYENRHSLQNFLKEHSSRLCFIVPQLSKISSYGLENPENDLNYSRPYLVADKGRQKGILLEILVCNFLIALIIWNW